MRSLIPIFLFVLAYCHGGTAIAQRERNRQQGQANQQVAVSPAPTPSVQPTIEKIETKPAGNEADRRQDVTVVDERSPWPSWIANGISALVLVFLAFQTLINKGMLKSMKNTETFLNTQCKALADQNETLKNSFRANSRAYVFISEAKLSAPISSGDFPNPNVVFANSGQTPAYRYRVRFQEAFLMGEEDEKARNGIMPPMRPLGEQGHALGPREVSTIHPDRPKWKSHEEREAAIRGLATYHIWGLVCYVDIFNDDHAYEFSLYAKNQNVTHLSWGRFGNDAEKENCDARDKSN